MLELNWDTLDKQTRTEILTNACIQERFQHYDWNELEEWLHDLIIDNMDSSCMCTSASVIYNGKEGPKFNMAMHGNPKGWSVTIPPGDEAQLKIYYDPNAHKELRGPVTRTVSSCPYIDSAEGRSFP